MLGHPEHHDLIQETDQNHAALGAKRQLAHEGETAVFSGYGQAHARPEALDQPEGREDDAKEQEQGQGHLGGHGRQAVGGLGGGVRQAV